MNGGTRAAAPAGMNQESAAQPGPDRCPFHDRNR
jgi:hypothetical protein